VAAGPTFTELLSARADADGFVPFDRWMDLALYGPSVGYYARRANPPGPAGDFYTAAQLHPIFAEVVAHHAASCVPSESGRLRWIEMGPGDGGLSARVVADLARDLGARRVEVALIDRSAAWLAGAEARVREVADPLGIPVTTAGSIAELGPVDGFVFANELLDAQPVERYRWTGSAWSELGVRLRDGTVVPAERPASRAGPGLDPAARWETGTIVERSPRAEAIVREVGDHLTAGRVVFADYGAEESELVAGHPHGTLAALRGHRPIEEFLAEPGSADLSAFVNFTRIRAAARAGGLREVGYRSQSETLVDWGIEALVARASGRLTRSEEKVRLQLAVKNLLFGFGTFRCLELGAGPAR
jgi:SAM-dependent MidA family methyltransferase